MVRKKILFNQNWRYAPTRLPLNASEEELEAITLPHSNILFPHNNIDNTLYQFTSTYRKKFNFSMTTESSHIFLEFDGVMVACEIYLNNHLVGEHLGGFISFSVDLTQHLVNGENILTVYVDSREREDTPPFGHLVDYLTFGGIYRDVHLLVVPDIFIDNLYNKPSDVLTAPRLACEVRLNRFAPGIELKANLINPEGQEIAQCQTEAQGLLTNLVIDFVPEISLWDIDTPVLYSVRIDMVKDGQVVDSLSSRFGFRQAEFRKDGGFYLNGNRVKLFGLNRHQTYPYIGAAAPARLQRQDADILKYELACNVVRTSHYPQSPHFLNRCDEIGLLVFEEITGWQHIGDDQWKEKVFQELEAMIERDRHHPSIILWGVRVNESPDSDDFYAQTNALARKTDPSRQTGGVRCITDSTFLEDVFTYNDFSNTVIDPVEIPYLITEYSGHMFPTKTWDHEERLIDHARLHTKIQDLQMGNPKISGAIGWCAFDYATHIEFGSGDRICYHGVMDTFRLPKWAAYFYKSQLDPSKEIVLQAATHWTMGDRNGGGNNPLTVFSNCDQIELVMGHVNLGKFTADFDSFPNLKHPPFTIFGLDKYNAWGQRHFHDLILTGFINGKPVIHQQVPSNRLPQRLELTADTDRLVADGADMCRIIIRITDDFNNPLPYATKIVEFELSGEAELIGENPFPLIGGQAVILLKAKHQPGEVTVSAKTKDLPGASVTINILPYQDTEINLSN